MIICIEKEKTRFVFCKIFMCQRDKKRGTSLVRITTVRCRERERNRKNVVLKELRRMSQDINQLGH